MVIDFFVLFNYPQSTWLALLGIFILLDILTIIHILLNKHHEPTSAILWIFLVVDFHILGVFLYLVLGINRIKTKGVKIEKYSKSMNSLRNTQSNLANYLVKLIEFQPTGKDQPIPEYQNIMDRILPGTFPVTGNKVELLIDGTDAYPKMLDAINNSREHIHLQSYIIMDDAVGEKIFNALYERSEQGVKIKVLFDGLGSSKAYKSRFFKQWIRKNKNFEVKPFSKLNLFTPYRIQLRNHRKLLICDGKTAFIGGINISAENDINSTIKSKHIHDLHCRIQGPCVGEFQYSFLKDWSFTIRKHPLAVLSEMNYFPEPYACGNEIVRVNPSGPCQAYEASKRMFLSAAASAKRSLWIITPYFVPDASFIQALCMSAARGVDVKIIIPQNNNHWYVRYATRSIYNRLLDANIKVFEKKGNFSHVKAMLIDGEWGTMGSSNCDVRSFKLNYELDCVIEGNEFIQILHDQFLLEISESEEITWKERSKRNIFEEIVEDFCSLLLRFCNNY